MHTKKYSRKSLDEAFYKGQLQEFREEKMFALSVCGFCFLAWLASLLVRVCQFALVCVCWSTIPLPSSSCSRAMQKRRRRRIAKLFLRVCVVMLFFIVWGLMAWCTWISQSNGLEASHRSGRAAATRQTAQAGHLRGKQNSKLARVRQRVFVPLPCRNVAGRRRRFNYSRGESWRLPWIWV